MVEASQEYLSGNYISHEEGWGFMKEDIWQDFSDWMYDNGLLGSRLDTGRAYTNEFLPR